MLLQVCADVAGHEDEHTAFECTWQVGGSPTVPHGLQDGNHHLLDRGPVAHLLHGSVATYSTRNGPSFRTRTGQRRQPSIRESNLGRCPSSKEQKDEHVYP